MIVTCPACGRKAAVGETARDVVCDCGRRFDPAARPTVADPFLGRELAGYRVEEVIGSGGMGTVYKATQLSLGRPVAVKVLPPNVADDPQFVHRFHREAEIMARLAHPHIVQVIDRGEAEGRFFIVMEYVDGLNLRGLVKRGPVPQKEACRIIAGLLEALDYAHRRGVVHRDIKPENVLVSHDGIVKVADFGLSRVLGGDDADTRLTRTHLVLGTYEYMAPEQREATREADARADIYAAAVVFYEMLTGELPIGRFALPSEKLPGVDGRVDAILERGLAKDPDDRYARASSMGAEIERMLSAPDAPVDLASLKQAAGKLGRQLKNGVEAGLEGVRRLTGKSDQPRPPTSYEMRLDLLLTVLAVAGILTLVGGALGLFVGGEPQGILFGFFGFLVWNSAERARKYWPGARIALLTLTALAVPTLIGIPFTIWTWRVLLNREMRAYYDARHRGLDEAEAAALAQGIPIPVREHGEARERKRRAVGANRTAAAWLFCLAFGVALVWTFGYSHGPMAFRDEGAGLLAAVGVIALLGAGLMVLASLVDHGRHLRLNAMAWSVLGLLSPGAARRARHLVRDRRDGLL